MKRTEPDPVPVAIPVVVLTVATDGTIAATCDGEVLEPPAGGPPWQRDRLPQIIDLASLERTRPVRVQVREADGTIFTDLIPARSRRTKRAESRSAPKAAPHGHKSTPPGAITVVGEGFVPGEQVAVAVITEHATATDTGAATATLNAARGTGITGGGVPVEVVLFGRVSGTIIVRHLP